MLPRSPLARFPGAPAAVLILLAAAGCGPQKRITDPFHLLAQGHPPVRVGVTELEHFPPPLRLPKQTLFEQNLAFHLHEPVSFDLMTPRQIRVHLGTGRLDFAMISAADYCEVVSAGNSRILAVPKNLHGKTSRRGLIIVAARSTIRSLSDIRGHRFHFMPRGDLLNDAALGALLAAGVPRAELDRGILGLELDTFHISSHEVAKSVVLENAAGVIDEADYDRWRDTGGSVLLLRPSKDEVRVIGHTVEVPEGPVLVSNETPPELAERVLDYLMNVASRQPLALAPLGISGFAEPLEPGAYARFCEVYRRLRPPPATQETPRVDGDEEIEPPPAT